MKSAFTVLLLMNCIQIFCQTPENQKRYIGELYGGGIVFYIFMKDGVEHGLIVSLQDLGDPRKHSGKTFSNVTDIEIGDKARSSWDGLSNSNAIVAQEGHVESAAKVCLDYVYSDSKGTYDDWYLPAIDELALLLRERYIIDRLHPTSAFVQSRYWSSTEISKFNGLVVSFSLANSISDVTGKGVYNAIRAVRNF